MPENPIYKFLKSNNLTQKDEDSFIKEYSNESKAQELYGFLKENKLTEKDFGSFYGEYFPKKDLETGSGNGLSQLGSGSNPFQSSQAPIAPTVLSHQNQKKYVQKQQNERQVVSDQLNNAQDAFRASQGDDLANEVQSIQTEQSVVREPEKDPTFTQSVGGTFDNFINSLKGTVPRLNMVANDALEKVLGKEMVAGMNALPRVEWSEDGIDLVSGRTTEEIRGQAIQELDYLGTQTKPTSGIVESAENFNIPGLAAGVVNAVGALASTAVPSMLSGGSLLVTDMVGGSLYDYNTAKAKSLGKTTEELYRDGQADFGVPATLGSIAFGLEKIGLKGMTNAINKQLVGSGAKKATSLFTEWNKEGATEWLQVGLDATNEALAQGKSMEDAVLQAGKDMFSKNGTEAYLMGVVGSGGASGLARLAKGMTNPKNKAKVEEDVATINRFTEEIVNPDASPATKAFVEKQIRSKVADVASTIDEDAESVEKFGAEQKQVIQDLQDRIEEMDEMIAESTVGESTSQIMTEERDKLVKELETILKEKPKLTDKDAVIEEESKEAIEPIQKDKITKEDISSAIDTTQDVNVVDFIDVLNNTGKLSEAESFLLGKYRERIDPDIKIKFDDLSSMGGTTAYANNKGKSITIDLAKGTNQSRPGSFQETVIHELTHPLTQLNESDPYSVKFYEDIDGLADIASEYFENNKEKFKVASNSNRLTYGLGATNEFIAEAMSNKDFQAMLSQIPYKGTQRSVWEEFVTKVKDFLKKTLNIGDNKTLLDEVTAIVTNNIVRQNSKINTPTQEGGKNAIQEQTTDEVSVQPTSEVSGEVVEGVSESGIQQTTNETVTQEVQVSEETQKEVAKVIDKKAEELKRKSSDKVLADQKKDMLDQLSEVESMREEDEGDIDIQKVRDLGYDVNEEGQVTFEVEGDGTFKIHVDNISDAIVEVKKQFPDKNLKKPDYKPKLSGANGKGKNTVTQTELDDAKDNLATATKSGNVKLQEVFQKELDRLNTLEVVEKPKPKAKKLTKLESAKAKLTEAKEKLKARNLKTGIASDPKEDAKALYEYHKALVNVAKEYISEGISNVQDFAKEIGEKLTKSVQDAWDEATGGNKKAESDFETKQVEPDEESDGYFDEEEIEGLGITKKEARKVREELGEEQYTYERKSREALEAEADKLMSEGFDVPKLIKRINKDPKASDVEIELLRRYYVSLTARINTNPTSALLQERKDLLSALDVLKTSAGRTVQAFDGLLAIEDNLATFLEQEGRYEELSDSEIENLTEKYNKAQEALNKYKALEEKAKEEALNKKLQGELDKEKRKSKPRGAVKEDFKQERKKIVEDFRAELKRIRSTPNVVILPYTRELIALAPFVKKMVASYVSEGVYDLKTIVKGIHDEYKEDIPELTEGDIKDILAGQYPNLKKTKNAKLAQVRDLETQARLENKIEDLENGILTTKSPVQRRVKSDKVAELEKQIALIKKRNPDLTYPSKLEGRKTWYKNRIKELQGEIAKGDFDEIVASVPIILDDEALKLKDEYIKFREETRIRRDNKEAEAMSELQKTLGKLKELTEIKRVVQTSIDVSIPLRQGVSVMFNPRTTKIGVEAYGKMLNTMFSEKKYNRLMYDIENNPAFLRSKDDGVVYTDLGSHNKELQDESHAIKGFIQRIPILGKGIKISARAAAAWTNYARFELYQRQVKFLEAQGKTRQNAKQAYEQASARVMTDTGRGKLPILSDKNPSKEGTAIKQALGTVFYGARLYSSTFRKLNPLYYLNPNVDSTVRVEALKDMIGYTASQIIVTTAIATALGATVSLDWDDPDFMKLRKGKAVVDLTAGQSVYIRTFLRLINAVYNRFSPDVSEKDANKYASFALQSVGTFWRNKLAPNTSYIWSGFAGKNSIGEKFDPYEIIKIYPMYTDDLINAFKTGSPIDALYILPLGLSGLGYQEYSKDIRKARVFNYVTDPKVESFLKRKKLKIEGDINQEVYDINEGIPVKMTKEQSDKYEKIWSEHITNKIKDNLPELNSMIEEKLDKEVTKFKTQATQIAKEAISGVSTGAMTIEKDNITYQLTPEQLKERINLNKEYIDKNRVSVERKIYRDKDNRGKSPLELTEMIERQLRSDANAHSKDIILEQNEVGKDKYNLNIKD